MMQRFEINFKGELNLPSINIPEANPPVIEDGHWMVWYHEDGRLLYKLKEEDIRIIRGY